MPNPYFSFKQFTVYHDRCAMKVGTDGVLLGAWVDVVSARNILDVGTWDRIDFFDDGTAVQCPDKSG